MTVLWTPFRARKLSCLKTGEWTKWSGHAATGSARREASENKFTTKSPNSEIHSAKIKLASKQKLNSPQYIIKSERIFLQD